jgi:Xaa-Pro dipeptidase
VFDDRDYPYAVNPQFKAWLPLTRAPGSWLVTPRAAATVIYLQPHDYWHVVPEAPSGWWVEHFDIAHHPHARGSRCRCCRRTPRAARSWARRKARWATTARRTTRPPVLEYLDYQRAYKTPYEIAMMREASRIGVRAHRAAERAFRAGASEFGIHLAYCQAAGQDANDLPYGNIVASTNTPRCCTTPTATAPPGARAQLPDRCRRQPFRLRQRHHPHLFRRPPAASSRR